MAKKDPRANSLFRLRGKFPHLEGRYDVLKDRPELVYDGSGSFIVLDNQAGIYRQMIASPNATSLISGSDLTPVQFHLGLNLHSTPWGSPFQGFDQDALVLFGEASGKDTPLNQHGAPARVGKLGMYAGNALPYKLPLLQKLLTLRRSAQGAINLTAFSGSGTVVNVPTLGQYNPNYMKPFQPTLGGEFQSGNLYIQGPVQPEWWSEANWALSPGSVGRAKITGTVGPNGVSAAVPSPYIYSSGSTVPFVGTQAVRFTSGAIKDLSSAQTFGKHFRSDATLTIQDVPSGSSDVALGEYIEDSGRLISSPPYKIVSTSELSSVFESSIAGSSRQETLKQYFDTSSFLNFLLCSGTTAGIPNAHRASFRFNSIAHGAQFDYGMRRLASSEKRFGFENQLDSNKSVQKYTGTGASQVLVEEGMQKDLMPRPAFAMHGYFAPVHMYTMAGGKYKNRRQVGIAVTDYDSVSGKTGLVEVARQFSGHIDITPSYEQTGWQTPGFFGFGWGKFPTPTAPFYSGSSLAMNAVGGLGGTDGIGASAASAIFTPEDWRPNIAGHHVTQSMKLNWGLYSWGLGSGSFITEAGVAPPEIVSADLYFWPDSYADDRLILRDKPEDHDISPTLDWIYTGNPRAFASASMKSVIDILNPLFTGSQGKLGTSMSQEEGIVWSNLQKFYFGDSEGGRSFPLRVSASNDDSYRTNYRKTPRASISLSSGTLRDFESDTGAGGQPYSKPQADSYPFETSVFHPSYNQVDSGDPYPWNVHGSTVPFQTFTKRNHLYSVNNSATSVDNMAIETIDIAYTPGPASSMWSLALLGTSGSSAGTTEGPYNNTNLGVERNSVKTSYPVLGAFGPVTEQLKAPFTWAYILGSRGDHPIAGTSPQQYISMGHPSHGYEYFMTGTYTSNNIAEEVPAGLVSMSTSGFDIPFSGSQDISIDLWVQFEKADPTEITQLTTMA